MTTKIDITKIVSDHLSTLKDYGIEEEYSTKDHIGFYILPFVLSVSATLLGLRVCEIETVLLTCFSIFAGLLFNLLVLVQGLITGQKVEPSTVKKRDIELKAFDVMHELFTNISYGILVSLLVIISVIFSFISTNNVFQAILTVISPFLVGNFIFTLLMILRRSHSALSYQSERHKTAYKEKFKNME